MRKKYRKPPFLSTELNGLPTSSPMPGSPPIPGEALPISQSVKSGAIVTQPASSSPISPINLLDRAKCKEIIQIVSGAQQEYVVYEGVSIGDYMYIMNRLGIYGHQKMCNRLSYFPDSARLMVSSPSAVHEAVLSAMLGNLHTILDTIPVPKTTIDCLTMSANTIRTPSLRGIPDLTLMICTKGGLVGRPVWVMECAFSQSDNDVMRKLRAYAQDLPDVLVIGKLLIKQAERYRSPGSNASIAPRLRSSPLMTQLEWTSHHGADEFSHIVVDGHTWFSLSSVEIHVWIRQEDGSKINVDRLDDDGYAVGTLYPTVDLDGINNAFRRGLERIKEAILLELAAGADREFFDSMAIWSPPDSPVNITSLRNGLIYGAWTTAYQRYAEWHDTLDKKPYNGTRGRSRTSRRRRTSRNHLEQRD
ncbi:hypothetical protein BKA82DRAFT_4265626 [Pisolithus tinctorius]|nr:hypothetical protein BKA82DRAFT_4265626 [Pisolithus tinctorius]